MLRSQAPSPACASAIIVQEPHYELLVRTHAAATCAHPQNNDLQQLRALSDTAGDRLAGVDVP